MRRYFITRGAKTTAGGTVVGGLTGFCITQVDIALEGEDRGLGLLEICLRSRRHIYEDGQDRVLCSAGQEKLRFGGITRKYCRPSRRLTMETLPKVLSIWLTTNNETFFNRPCTAIQNS